MPAVKAEARVHVEPRLDAGEERRCKNEEDGDADKERRHAMGGGSSPQSAARSHTASEATARTPAASASAAPTAMTVTTSGAVPPVRPSSSRATGLAGARAYAIARDPSQTGTAARSQAKRRVGFTSPSA